MAARNRDSPLPVSQTAHRCLTAAEGEPVGRVLQFEIEAVVRRGFLQTGDRDGRQHQRPRPSVFRSHATRMLTNPGSGFLPRSWDARSSRSSLVAVLFLKSFSMRVRFAVQRSASGLHERGVIEIEDGLTLYAALLTVVDGPLEGSPGCLVHVHIDADVHLASASEPDQPFVVEFGGPRKMGIRIVALEWFIALAITTHVFRRTGEVQVSPVEGVFRISTPRAPVLDVRSRVVLRNFLFAVDAQ